MLSFEDKRWLCELVRFALTFLGYLVNPQVMRTREAALRADLEQLWKE